MTKSSAVTIDLVELYAQKRTDELLRLAEEKDSLHEAARQALDAEMQRRGLVEGGMTDLETQDHEEAEPPAEGSKRIGWFIHLLRTAGIFVAAATLDAIVLDRFVGPTNPDLAETAGEIFGKAALALGFLGSALGPRIATLKRTMIAAVIFLIAVFAWSWMNLAANTPEKHADVTTDATRYHGSGFSMTIPSASTSVRVTRETKKLSGQEVVESSYSFRNGEVLYEVMVGDFSDHAGGTPDEAFKFMLSHLFDPGYHMTNSTSHLGTLPAAYAEAEGTRGGLQLVLKARLAFSADYKRSWIVVAMGSTVPVTEVDKFMDSIQVN